MDFDVCGGALHGSQRRSPEDPLGVPCQPAYTSDDALAEAFVVRSLGIVPQPWPTLSGDAPANWASVGIAGTRTGALPVRDADAGAAWH